MVAGLTATAALSARQRTRPAGLAGSSPGSCHEPTASRRRDPNRQMPRATAQILPARRHVALALVVAAILVALVPARAGAELLGKGAGRAICAAYGFSWGLQQMVNYDFHEIAFAVPLLAFSLSALVRGRMRTAVLWALPLVSFAQWQAQQREVFGATSYDLVHYATYQDRLGILTANATTPYNNLVQAATGLTASAVEGSRTVQAAYLELDVPIAKSIDLDVADRQDRYSDFGTSNNPKVSVRYQPASYLTFRGTASTGFRAPTLFDLYQSPSLAAYDATRAISRALKGGV